METIINLIIQLIAGVAGGNAAGAALKDYNLGNLDNTIAGAIGGVGGGQILQALIPAIASAAGGDLDLGAIVGQIVGGGAGGAILTIIAGLVKNMTASQQTRCGSRRSMRVTILHRARAILLGGGKAAAHDWAADVRA